MGKHEDAELRTLKYLNSRPGEDVTLTLLAQMFRNRVPLSTRRRAIASLKEKRQILVMVGPVSRRGFAPTRLILLAAGRKRLRESAS
jgi:hypothetical protein